MEKIPIWGQMIPGNSDRKKSDVMELSTGILKNPLVDTFCWLQTLRSKFTPKSKKTIDTYTARWVFPKDEAYQVTFTDIPYLIPFPASRSKKAVIVVPGGGYCYKSMEGEGINVARELQTKGISAFVLWYRTNPYYQPYPLMDFQRAVCFVRFHAKDYGFDPDQVGAIGFSGGGAQISLFLNVLRSGHISLPEFEKDEIDSVSDELNFAGLVYPALNYRSNPNLLFASFPAQQVRDEAVRAQLMSNYDAVDHFCCPEMPHFVCYGTRDHMVSIPFIQDYIQKCKDIRVVAIKGADHGYGFMANSSYNYWMQEFVDWLHEVTW